MKSIKIFLVVMLMISLCFAAAWWDATKDTNTYINASTYNLLNAKGTEEETDTLPTIMLDAGHGGYDGGSVSYEGVKEKDITLAITLLVGEQLAAQGYPVVYTRTSDDVTWESDNLSDLRERVSMAQRQEVDYYISIHTNSSDYNDGAYGFESYLDYTNSTIVSMAESIHKELTALHYSQDRGLKSTQESSLYVIDQNSVPAMLLEIGFISDRDDAWYMINSQEAIANAIATGIMSAISL